MRRPRAARAGWALGLCAAVVALDQGTKALVRASIVPGERVHLVLGFQLDDVRNHGVAFGLRAGGEAVTIALAVAAVALLAVYLAGNAARPGVWVVAGLIGGGALGNLVDRVRLGWVTDFIDPPLWPAFNLADVAIVVGVGLILLQILRES